MADVADYDAGEITDRERQAAENQTATSKQNVLDVRRQLARQLENYDYADALNRELARRQLQQNSRKTSSDRFEAQRDLQAATMGLLGSMGTALNGSSRGNLEAMLRQRNDKDNDTYWAQHQVNQDAVLNSLQDSVNQNAVARRDAMQSAEKATRDIESEWRSNLNNINPNLYSAPKGSVGGDPELDSNLSWRPDETLQRQYALTSGYTPTYLQQAPTRATSGNTDYYRELTNRLIRR